MSDDLCIHEMENCAICKPPEAKEARIYCVEPGCKEFVNDDRWSKTKAEGWFFKKNDDAYCPEHVPDWVEGWRAKR